MPSGAQRRRPLAPLLALALGCALGFIALVAPAASAHVVPTSTIQLDVGDTTVAAAVAIPLTDLESASGVDLAEQTQAAVDDNADAIESYLLAHFRPTTDEGVAWTVTDGDLIVSDAGDTSTTGIYAELETTLTLTPPIGTSVSAEEGSFDLGYDAVVDRVATHVVIVTVRSDTTSSSSFDGAYEVGVIRRSTVTNTVEPLHVDLSSGGTTGASGFLAMVGLGMQHIREGTDHQLFLLTLLLPAPLLARRRRWAGAVPATTAVRRIATTTLSFTLGHSLTLALGAWGMPVSQGLVEALIAASILVAALHAIRPVFPGREAAVAGAFGLVHGLAFSEALRALDLTGSHLVLALLGFNVGVEAMQFLVVALVLPPLTALAGSPRYQALRIFSAGVISVAALGWLGARLGVANPVADLADRLGVLGLPAVLLLWLAWGWRIATRRTSASALISLTH